MYLYLTIADTSSYEETVFGVIIIGVTRLLKNSETQTTPDGNTSGRGVARILAVILWLCLMVIVRR
jgi:hypothetical protein